MTFDQSIDRWHHVSDSFNQCALFRSLSNADVWYDDEYHVSVMFYFCTVVQFFSCDKLSESSVHWGGASIVVVVFKSAVHAFVALLLLYWLCLVC